MSKPRLCSSARPIASPTVKRDGFGRSRAGRHAAKKRIVLSGEVNVRTGVRETLSAGRVDCRAASGDRDHQQDSNSH